MSNKFKDCYTNLSEVCDLGVDAALLAPERLVECVVDVTDDWLDFATKYVKHNFLMEATL